MCDVDLNVPHLGAKLKTKRNLKRKSSSNVSSCATFTVGFKFYFFFVFA